MALARCDQHKPELMDPEVVSYALPIGYPTTAVTCDVVGCAMPARLWLSADERKAFLAGDRVCSRRRLTAPVAQSSYAAS